MLVGHFAAAMIGKRVEPKLSLGTLGLAALVADVLWCIFMAAGLESVHLTAGARGAGHYLTADRIAWSHSLLTNVLWGGVLAAAYFVRRRNPRGAWVLLAAVLSHWLLDTVSHSPDMPLAPATSVRFGMGLWTSVPATLIVEGGFWLIAIALYASATRGRSVIAALPFWGAIPILTLIWYNNIAGPPPPNLRTLPYASLTLFALVVAWAYWVNRLRPTRLQLIAKQ